VTANAERVPFYRRRWFVPVVVVAALVIGYLLGGGGSGGGSARVSEKAVQSEVRFWTCSMHPQIRQPEPGLCPICAMDLIPVYEEGSGEESGPRSRTFSETARELAGIQVAMVERRSPDVEIRMAGKVEVDETRLGYITARMAGRIDRLWVDYTGVLVHKGDPMVDLYSPELVSAQEELLQAAEAAGPAGSDPDGIVDMVRDKLRLWDVSEDQIDDILRRGSPSEHLTLRSPMGGVVLDRHATTGMYVTTGMQIYTIADLSHVWVTLDAYESDLVWIREGQEVRFEVEAYPGESFDGRVAFVDPVVNARTRTVRVRVEAANPDSRLKPEMFVRAVLRAGEPPAGRPPLVIPATAPLITGKRAVVYVQSPGDEGRFDGREVVLGPRAGEYYIVREGLSEGELVVVNGAFKIDSAVQILAKPSMMNPEGGGAPAGHHHGAPPAAAPGGGAESYGVPGAFTNQLDHVFMAYFAVQQALSHDTLDGATKGAEQMARALEAVDMGLLDGPAHNAWMRELGPLADKVDRLAGSKDIDGARRGFDLLSLSLIRVAKTFDPPATGPVRLMECSMAFDNRSARWLQNKPGVENPYFGSAMFKCGEELEVIHPGGAMESGEPSNAGHAHE